MLLWVICSLDEKSKIFNFLQASRGKNIGREIGFFDFKTVWIKFENNLKIGEPF